MIRSFALLGMFLLAFNGAGAQTIRYFSPYFQNVVVEETDFQRTYFTSPDEINIVDTKDGVLQEKATIYGVTNIDQVDQFAWYCINHVSEINYRDFFKNVKGDFSFYKDGELANQVIVRDKKMLFSQVWSADGEELLTDGNGQNTFTSEEFHEEISEIYQDSVLLLKYGIRSEAKDTVYYTVDKGARPKEGLSSFYQNFIAIMKYPGLARLAGKEGRVYVQFVVDENGQLIDFMPLTNEGFRFEARTIKKLSQLPNWIPARYHGRPVKTKFILPVNFKLTN